MADLIFVGQFIASKVGQTGLTVTIDVDRYTLADGTRAALVTGGSATEGRRGLYHYRLASADLSLYQYVATFITTDTSVDQREIAAIGLVVPDALVSSRVAPTDVGRTLALTAAGEVSANLTDESLAVLLNGLSGTTVTVVSSVDGGLVTVYVADTWRFTVASDQLDLADYETLGLVVKRNERQADSQALLYVRSDTGLARIGGAAPVSAGNGTLTAGASSFTAVVHVAETQGVKPGNYTWWLKGLDTSATPDEATTLATGSFVVLAAGLQAVV